MMQHAPAIDDIVAGRPRVEIEDAALGHRPGLIGRVPGQNTAGGGDRGRVEVDAMDRGRAQAQRPQHRQSRAAADIEKSLAGEGLGGEQRRQISGRLGDAPLVNGACERLPVVAETEMRG